jgi:crotonobetainyl-CoA:carnitine CoA-transferase CaiB-like acyl-CoA transferase
LDYASCEKVRPDLIYLAVSGYGQTGARAERPADDQTIQAHSGVMALTGEVGGPPILAGNGTADFGAAAVGAYSACAALFHHERTGEGQR